MSCSSLIKFECMSLMCIWVLPGHSQCKEHWDNENATAPSPTPSPQVVCIAYPKQRLNRGGNLDLSPHRAFACWMLAMPFSSSFPSQFLMPACYVMTIGVRAYVMFSGSNSLSLVLGVSLWSTKGQMGSLTSRRFWGKKEYKSKGNQVSLILLLVDNLFVLNTKFQGEFVSLWEETRLDLSPKNSPPG